jgi:enoyl-CoA hydratase
MSGGDGDRKSLVTYHAEGPVGFITLNRPEKRNALNTALWRDLDRAVAQAEKDETLRVVLLRGEGKSFCAGLDLGPENEIISVLRGPPNASQKESFFKLVREVQGIHTRLERLPVPTIAVIQAHCLGAGLEMVLCCDIRICSADAIFALPEARLAIITDVGGLQRLPRVVGPGHAREIAFRGHAIDAEKARRINLVNEVYPDKESLFTEAMKIAEDIAANPPLAVQGAKDVLLFTQDTALSRSLDYNAARSSMIMPSEDLFEAISAHLQKRKGKFKGT